jgi:FkbM family methyltransferase
MNGQTSRLGVRNVKPALRGWFACQRARLAHRRHPDLGEISAYCFYSTKLRFHDLAFDIGANRGEHTREMLRRGAQVVALEPQAKLAAELAKRFPTATVLPMAVGDGPGHAVLHVASKNDRLASLDASWAENYEDRLTWSLSERVGVTTADELIREYGLPTLMKIDTEGFEHRVLRGLSQPIDHILFEVHAGLADIASDAFARLEQLGSFEYFVMPANSWLHREAQQPEEILADLPVWGDVYARRVR